MHPSLLPPRRVEIGDAASFVGTTPRAIRHHQIGLLPEPQQGSDGRRLHGYDEVIRPLWIRKTADAGIALGDIRDDLGALLVTERIVGPSVRPSRPPGSSPWPPLRICR